MASTAMRLAIIHAREDNFFLLIDAPHFEPPAPRPFFETQVCARPAPAGAKS
jgi:hypothetical protein